MPNEFFVQGENDKELAKALGITEEQIAEYRGKNVIYLAVNKDNSKQIRITIGQNAFTYSTVNISNFSNDKIAALVPQIVEIEDVKGEIITKNGQKFIKTQLRSADSGGEYILTQYITVADKHSFVLSFYTDVNADRAYIEDVFKSFECDYFVNEKNERRENILEYVLPAFTIVFAVASVLVAASILIDVRKRKVAKEEEEIIQEEFNEL